MKVSCFYVCSFFFTLFVVNSLSSCSNSDSDKLGKLGSAIDDFAEGKLKENIHFIRDPNSTIFSSGERAIRRIKGVKPEGREYFTLLSDLKKIDGKTLTDARGSNKYEMDFKAVVNVEAGSTSIYPCSINFWGFNYYYDEKGTHPFRYILIQGIAYFERKESGWVFKEFNVRRAEQTNSDKILE
ncbi:MAG TPA: hypothetical protein PKY86_05940 [Niabella sp.]|nr:hypothetical protein [Niabella sp.]HQW13612.1 hypothetical protein [Niabella sp.]HQX19006.1 hypothetical protein [Niabella sp.]HQX42420.1 hypothetical protein [Niabella sp.]HRB06297.1 hypothetical protein [Niabella sp.]